VIPDEAYVAVRGLVAAILLTSGLAKLRSPHAFTATLQALGLPAPRLWWAIICTAEVGAAIAAVAGPSWLAAPLVAVLAIAFAGAGLKAMASGQSISCACFGGQKPSRLGHRQVAALPLWALAVAAVGMWQPSHLDHIWQVATLAIVVVLAPQLVMLRRAAASARRDRIATTGLSPAQQGQPAEVALDLSLAHRISG
jgi:uncharacterized membrane protein YphA (DoxX/SURF4 family)